jgi:putative hemolysin
MPCWWRPEGEVPRAGSGFMTSCVGPGASEAGLVPPPEFTLKQGKYRLRFAGGAADVDAALRLRFRVFNLEIGEGLDSSHETGRDQDPFDACCHHLLVEDVSTGEVIGTYRMQTREMAAGARGFYTAGEFDLQGLPPDMV